MFAWIAVIELADVLWFGSLAAPVALAAAAMGYGDDDDDGEGGFHHD